MHFLAYCCELGCYDINFLGLLHEMEDFTLVLESLDLQLMKAFYRFLISSKIKKIQII